MSRRPPPRNRKPRRGPGRSGARRAVAPGGQTVEVVIDHMGAHGDGVAAHAGGPLYVPGALTDERVRVRTGRKAGDGLAATLLDVLDPAPTRIAPICPVYATCGGCALQHMHADAYAAWKRARVDDALAKRGFTDPPVFDPVPVGPGTRRRVTWTARKRGGALDFGFNVRAGHALVDVDACPLLVDALNHAIPALRELLARVLADGAQARVAATALDGGLDVLVEADADPTPLAREDLAAFVARGDALRLAWRAGTDIPEPIAQTRPPVVKIADVAVELPMGAFLQPSEAGERALVERVLDGVGDAGRVADLYCGVGTFALPLAVGGPLATNGRVVRAVDGLEAPVRALERAAGRADLGGRVLAEVRDLDRRPLTAKEANKFDAVVFDPPRAGAARQAETLAESRVPRVVAVSCHPATFARDARILVDGGYTLRSVTPVDQFTFSPHVELVARFER